MEKAGFCFEIMPSSREEKTGGGAPFEVARQLSRMKALDIFEKLREQESKRPAFQFPEAPLRESGAPQQPLLVIGADTIVAYKGQILGKPRSTDEAVYMLEKLQGATHRVYTGVTLCSRKAGAEAVRTFHECTEVTFYPLEETEIRAYVETGEPMDKAGAYGIQGRGALFVRRIMGDYSNVVGLPVARLCREMRAIW